MPMQGTEHGSRDLRVLLLLLLLLLLFLEGVVLQGDPMSNVLGFCVHQKKAPYT